ncbi:MAG: regulatory protein RecX [Actinomycetota bacterium]
MRESLKRPAPAPPAQQEEIARSLVLRQLTGSPKSRAHLTEVLLRRGIDHDVATRVLDRMEEVGLVDDAAFADSWVRYRHREKGSSRRLLARELHNKGIAPDIIDASVTQISEDDERKAVRQLIQGRLSLMADLPVETRQRRLLAMALRKGYEPELAYTAVREALPGGSDH